MFYDIGPLDVPETPSRMRYRQDSPKDGCPWDILGTPGGTVGHTGHWDNCQGGSLPMGLWDRQDTGTTAKGGSSWNVPGTPNRPVGQTGHWDNCQGWES